jgi:hypothetical protein
VHELVHVHQYGALGLETFMYECIASVVAYRTTAPYRSKASPTRRRAYVLNPEEAFSVAEMVRAMRRWSGA